MKALTIYKMPLKCLLICKYSQKQKIFRVSVSLSPVCPVYSCCPLFILLIHYCPTPPRLVTDHLSQAGHFKRPLSEHHLLAFSMLSEVFSSCSVLFLTHFLLGDGGAGLVGIFCGVIGKGWLELG